jgi:hypothetical protein
LRFLFSINRITPESTTTRTAGGSDFTAKGGKRQGREVPQSLKITRVKPGAEHTVWKTQTNCRAGLTIKNYLTFWQVAVNYESLQFLI